MTDYTIKRIDKEFWRQVRILAAQRDTTIKALIFSLLQREIDNSK